MSKQIGLRLSFVKHASTRDKLFDGVIQITTITLDNTLQLLTRLLVGFIGGFGHDFLAVGHVDAAAFAFHLRCEPRHLFPLVFERLTLTGTFHVVRHIDILFRHLKSVVLHFIKFHLHIHVCFRVQKDILSVIHVVTQPLALNDAHNLQTFIKLVCNIFRLANSLITLFLRISPQLVLASLLRHFNTQRSL